jgi:hypothetical protein
MTLRYKILGGVLVPVAVALLSLGLWVSHDSACGTAALLPGNGKGETCHRQALQVE